MVTYNEVSSNGQAEHCMHTRCLCVYVFMRLYIYAIILLCSILLFSPLLGLRYSFF